MPSRRYDHDYEDDYDDRDEYDDRPRRRLPPHRGSMVLVLGLLSLLVCGLLGPVAWVMGSADLREMRAGRMDPSGESETRAGYICGIIASVLLGLGLVGVILWFLFVFVLIGAAGAAR